MVMEEALQGILLNVRSIKFASDSDGSEIILGPATSTDKMILIEVLDQELPAFNFCEETQRKFVQFNGSHGCAWCLQRGSFEQKGRG